MYLRCSYHKISLICLLCSFLFLQVFGFTATRLSSRCSSPFHLSAKRKTTLSRGRLPNPNPNPNPNPSSNANPIEQFIPNQVEEEDDLKDEFQNDLRDFQRQQQITSTTQSQEENGFVKSLKDAISLVLVADFFVVMIFLLWFLLAVVLKGSYPVVLERFQDIFNPIVVPSLTVLMAGSMASGLLGDRKPNSE